MKVKMKMKMKNSFKNRRNLLEFENRNRVNS